MKIKSLLALSTSITLLALPILSGAANFMGKLVGHHCAHEGKICPVDKLDPHITLERDFVLVSTDNDYYFLPNLPRDVKVRHVLEDVVISGDLEQKHNVITAKELKLKNGDKVVWSAKLQKQIESIFEHFDGD